MPHTKHHTKLVKLNCTDFLVQDWQYQDWMAYSEEIRQRLIYRHNNKNDTLLQWTMPPYMQSSKCSEMPQELAAFVKRRLSVDNSNYNNMFYCI
mmetsp:Transcript_40750/g.97710  ORF Transcript_40750/g.97710 Transcript_40750/m.97710 type:complete len:94 (-) Transcript_40750:515-796(-)